MSQYEDDADLLFEECPNCGELNIDCTCDEFERERLVSHVVKEEEDGRPL